MTARDELEITRAMHGIAKKIRMIQQRRRFGEVRQMISFRHGVGRQPDDQSIQRTCEERMHLLET